MSRDLLCYENFQHILETLFEEQIECEIIINKTNKINLFAVGDVRRSYKCIVTVKTSLTSTELKFSVKPNFWLKEGFNYFEKMNQTIEEVQFVLILHKFANNRS